MNPIFVKTHPHHGKPGVWKITGRDNAHYTLRHLASGEKTHLYIGHTFEDFETKRLGFEERKKLADTLGNRLKKRK